VIHDSIFGMSTPFNASSSSSKQPFHTSLVHLSNKSIDLVFPVTQITALNVMSELSCTETASGVAELEGPEEVRGLLEVGADGEDLVDQIFHADNAELSETSLNEGVVGESNALLVNLSIATLVDQLPDGLEVGISVSNPGLDNLEHLKSGLGQTDEDTIVNLEKTKELEDLARLRRNLVDTVPS
jgi:hypothetical protein